MATVDLAFRPGELLCVGGDYGEIVLTGIDQPTRDALREITDRTRSSGRQPRIVLFVTLDDDPPPVIEARHAGREGTPESGVPYRYAEQPESIGAESVAATGAATGSVADHP